MSLITSQHELSARDVGVKCDLDHAFWTKKRTPQPRVGGIFTVLMWKKAPPEPNWERLSPAAFFRASVRISTRKQGLRESNASRLNITRLRNNGRLFNADLAQRTVVLGRAFQAGTRKEGGSSPS